MWISEKGLVTSMVLKTIRRSKKNKKSRYAITNVSLKDISNIIKEFEKLPYEGYLQKSSKYVTTDGFFYISRQIDKCMVRLNFPVGPVRTQMTNTQKMNNSEISTQNITNYRVCSSDESE